MASTKPEPHEALAEFRYQLRKFQHFSDQAARNANLEPQQHQLLLAVMGSADERLVIGEIAERLQIQHHSAVGLVARAEGQGLVERNRSATDRRQVYVTLTERGRTALQELSAVHRQELQSAAPELIRILQRILDADASTP